MFLWILIIYILYSIGAKFLVPFFLSLKLSTFLFENIMIFHSNIDLFIQSLFLRKRCHLMYFSWRLESKRKKEPKVLCPNSKNVNSENFSSLSSFSNLAICDSMRFGYWKYLYNHIESNSPYYWMESSNQNHHSYTGQGWYHLDKNRHQKINCFWPLLSVLQYIDTPGNTLYLCMAHSNLLHQNCSFHCWSSLGKNRLQPMDLRFQH